MELLSNVALELLLCSCDQAVASLVGAAIVPGLVLGMFRLECKGRELLDAVPGLLSDADVRLHQERGQFGKVIPQCRDRPVPAFLLRQVAFEDLDEAGSMTEDRQSLRPCRTCVLPPLEQVHRVRDYLLDWELEKAPAKDSTKPASMLLPRIDGAVCPLHCLKQHLTFAFGRYTSVRFSTAARQAMSTHRSGSTCCSTCLKDWPNSS